MYKHIPYTTVDGVPTFKDSEIKELWDRVWAEGFGDALFHDGSIANCDQFLKMVKSPSTLFWVVLKQSYPVAMWWLNRLEQTHAYCHFTAFKVIWGTQAVVSLGKEAMHICFDELGLKLIMGMTPSANKLALRYIKKVGLKTIGEVPHLLKTKDGGSASGILSYITREDLSNDD